MFTGLLCGVTFAQTSRQPANLTTIPSSTPQEFDVLDNAGTWVPIIPYDNHAVLLASAKTPSGSWSIRQRGFYASGDGGAAIYDWNANSYCAGGGPGTPADGFLCVLPIDHSASAPGRYLIRLENGKVNAKTIGFRDDGVDNAPMVHTLNTMLSKFLVPVNFPPDPAYPQANYWFSQPLELVNSAWISCGDGSRQNVATVVNLVFGPGISGPRIEGYGGISGFDGGGTNIVTLRGCGIIGTGWVAAGSATIAGNPVINNNRFSTSGVILNGAINPEPTPAVGDGIALFNGPSYWYFNGSITGDVLTVTDWQGGWSATDPGIAPGQMLQGYQIPYGTFILATHAEDSTYTGTGQLGTYLIRPSIASPGVPSQAQPGTITGGYNTETQTGPPLVLGGTTVVSCTNPVGLTCPHTDTSTLTLSNAPRLGMGYIEFLYPGPNTSYAYGSQMYNVTTSLTGQWYGPFTGSASGYVLTITDGGSGGLNLGQVVSLGTPGGGVTTTTTTASLTIGEGVPLSGSIPVASCAGITAGMYVLGTASGHAVFGAGTTVANCAGTSLMVNYEAGGTGAASVTNGSNLATVQPYYYHPYPFWTGLPMTGEGIPSNTVVSGPVQEHPIPGLFYVPMSNAATSTTGSLGSGAEIEFGGATYAAPSGTTLTFLSGATTIYTSGTGTGGNGTYGIDYGGTIAPGTTFYAYDTPSTMYVTGGPRMVQPGDLLWTDAFPFGAIAGKIYGVDPSKLTVIAELTGTYGEVASHADHAAGSGSMWTMPSGIGQNGSANIDGNTIMGFAVGLNMSCGGIIYPQTGCGRSGEHENNYSWTLIGRMDSGNNSGGSNSLNNEYDHNFIADIAELSTLGTTFTGDMLQGEDESSNSHDFISGCTENYSSLTGIYASGAQYNLSCLTSGNAMVSNQPGFGFQHMWIGPIYGGPADGVFPLGYTAISTNCNGPPTGSFQVQGGVVTHC